MKKKSAVTKIIILFSILAFGGLVIYGQRNKQKVESETAQTRTITPAQSKPIEKIFLNLPAIQVLNKFGPKPSLSSLNERKMLEKDWNDNFLGKWVKWEGILAGDVAMPSSGAWSIGVRVRDKKYLDKCGMSFEIMVSFNPSENAKLRTFPSESAPNYRVSFEGRLGRIGTIGMSTIEVEDSILLKDGD